MPIKMPILGAIHVLLPCEATTKRTYKSRPSATSTSRAFPSSSRDLAALAANLHIERDVGGIWSVI